MDRLRKIEIMLVSLFLVMTVIDVVLGDFIFAAALGRFAIYLAMYGIMRIEPFTKDKS